MERPSGWTGSRNSQSLTCDGELGVGDVRTTHHTVVALVFVLAVPDLQRVEVAHAADLILVTGVKFLGALVPGEGDLRVVDPNAAPEGDRLVLCCRLVADVLQH